MPSYYDRYKEFRGNGTVKPLPGIFIPESANDIQEVYEWGKTRLDKLSQKYYNSPYYGFLILSANPQYGGMEFDIPDGEVITIPFPFRDAIERYETEVEEHLRLYGE